MPVIINKYVGIVSGANASAALVVPSLYLTNSIVSNENLPGDVIGEFFLSNRESEEFELVNTVEGAFAITAGNVLIVGPAGVPAAGGVYTLIIQSAGYQFEAKVTVVNSLVELTLSNNTFSINTTSGTVIGDVIGVSPGSTLAIVPADDRVALNSANQLIVGTQNVDTPVVFSINLVETNLAAPNSPRTTNVSIDVVPPLPVNNALPEITGTPIVGGTLTRTLGTWANDPTSFATQWLLDGDDIPGATGATLAYIAAYVDHDVSVQVDATNDAGTTSATSQAVRAEYVIYAGEVTTYTGSDVTYPTGGY